ncbi:MAG: hypothetical protein JSS86_09320, partial [Cyanobacteria bacterium SZAS LIN-2]|nr:hypothetical protein [Cyanobacteria bacterium SZAS LIN-2]
MPPSVRKSICLIAPALAAGLLLAAPVAAAPTAPKAVQVKTLDDNKEVLRPIPAVLAKPAKAPAKEPAKEQATEPVKKPAKETIKEAKAVAKVMAKTAETKTAETKTAEIKTAAKTRKKVVAAGAHFVPPPPPFTPTMMGDVTDFGMFSGVPVELLSKDALKDRAKEISIQYKDACRELEDHTQAKQDKIQRAKDFVGLYQEGVVSRRELEASQKEANEVNSDIDRLTFKTKELKGLLDRINKRLSSPAAKKPGHKLIN